MPPKTAPAAATTTTPITLPALPSDLFAALKADVAARGVLVPIVVDSTTGEVLDGRVRSEIARQLAIRDIPTIFLGKLTAKDRQEIRNGLNVYRRHLTRQQIQECVLWALRQTPHDSDRKIAPCSHQDHALLPLPVRRKRGTDASTAAPTQCMHGPARRAGASHRAGKVRPSQPASLIGVDPGPPGGPGLSTSPTLPPGPSPPGRR